MTSVAVTTATPEVFTRSLCAFSDLLVIGATGDGG